VKLSDLNEAQEEAVTHGAGPLLVLAGAGSGKTRVITYRIAHLLRRGVPAARILALSFTNKAAREVAGRVRGLVGAAASAELTVCTFHALGLSILRQDIRRLGFDPRFTLFGEGDQRSAVREIVKDTALPLDPGEVHAEISLWKNRAFTPEDVPVRPGDRLREAMRDTYAAYQALLRAQNAVDFDDLLLLPLRLFRDHPDALAFWQERFHHLLVDEYQDTNPVQFQLLQALTGRRRNLCVVGDDDQSIYGWRGADVKLILQFEHHYPGARVILLEENYRSTQTILESAHGVVAGIADRRPKKLFTRRAGGPPLGWIEADTGALEAEEVVGAILADRFRRHRPWSEFVVLYRTNAQSRLFEEALRAQDVPYRVVGGSRFFDRKEVRDVLCYLRAMHNPRDDASLLRIANTPRRGLGPQTILRLREQAEASGASLRRVLAEAPDLSPQARAGARTLLALLERYGARFRAEGVTPDNLGEFIREAGLRAEVEAGYDSLRAVRKRLDLLDDLVQSVADAPRVNGKADLGLYIEKLNLDPPATQDDEDEEAVTLMTLHSAKGLEFPVVFLTGLEEGLLPHAREAQGDTADLPEERRLCYVGMTRARERLVLSHAKTRRRRGSLVNCTPSRFLAEVPVQLTARSADAAPPDPEEEKVMAGNFFKGMQDLLG
jgi:superfamily I DNA/RNA helicase